jgi:hypothetical protein
MNHPIHHLGVVAFIIPLLGAPAYRFRLCGGERLLSGSDDFTLFLWRPLASWRQDGGRKPWEMGMVYVCLCDTSNTLW